MESNNQDQVKDLQYWKDFLAKKNGWNSFAQWKNHENLHEENLTLKAIDLMVNDRVQQAKDAAFKEAELKYRELVQKLADWSRKYPRGRVYSFHKAQMDDELIALEEEAKTLCPYTTWEKGGEDTNQTT